jgi:hypothetical protein
MKNYLPRFLFVCLILVISSLSAFGQTSTVGSITGTVKDPHGAVVANASITVKNSATGLERTTTSSEDGIFTVPQLPTGTYKVTIQASSGFKKAEVTGVKVDVGTPTAVNVALEIGTSQETVTIVGGGEVLQTQTANIGNTITGRQITELPFTSRDALDLVLALPGSQTPARPRSSTINGLPRGSLTITLDGLPDQAEDSKSSDGFFTFVRPRIDAIEEVSLSSAVPGAESSGEGAAQIRFSTKRGGNEYHGSGYWYHRNTWLNSNYFFNNQAGTPRQAMILNQPGVRIGGPILIPGLIKSRDRAQFFVNYEEFRIPGSTARQRTVLGTDAAAGIFKYGTSGSVNLLTLAAAKGQTATIDPTIGSMLGKIRGSLSGGSITSLSDPNLQRFTWNSPASQVRKFSTVRFDFKVSKKHSIENIWNYNVFKSSPDQLNSRDPVFPGLGIGVGGQYSLRFSDSFAVHSTLKPNLVNELRLGKGAGGTVLFFPETNAGAFSDLGGFRVIFPLVSSPASGSSSSRNHAPAEILVDNLSWVKGNHSLNFGVDYANYHSFSFSVDRVVPQISLGVDTTDPANSTMFVGANFPGASSTDLANAAGLWALLVGRVTTITANAFTSETTGKYTYLGDFTQRVRQRTLGMYTQDAWRFRPNLTINAGLRYELQFPWVVTNGNYTQVDGGYNGVWGVSGPGNLFKPGTLTGSVTQFVPFPQKKHAYNTDWNNFGPSIGFAWSPNSKGFLRKIMGDSGQTVLRGGYSIAFVREGSDVMNSVIGGNPGGVLAATRSIGLGTLTAGTLFRNPASLAPPTIPAAPVYPITPTSVPAYSPNDGANAFLPDIKTGYVQSWSLGIQRELTKDTVLEARYVANRGTDLWRQFDLNETNITENGFLAEYRLAQANLAKNGGANFRYLGPGTGTFPLPIMAAYAGGFTSAQANNCTTTTVPSCATVYASAAVFATSTGFIANLGPNNSNARAFAQALYGNAPRRANAIAAGYPSNLFVVNPNVIGNGAFVVDNGGRTWYDSLQVELRRRLSRGLLVQGSYVFSKSLANMYGTSGAVFYQPRSLRDESLDHNLSPFDLTHAVKANWIWELPFGKGREFLGSANGLVDRLAGGWAIHGQARIQSGSTISFGNVQLVGMTAKELQKLMQIRKTTDATGAGVVFFLPDDIILNTRRANNTTATGFSSLGAPTGQYIAPANSGGCVQAFVGQCGFANLILHGPHLTRFDISVVKKTKITETVNLEMRAEFLNAFNNINFKLGSQTAADTGIGSLSAATFGQVTAAYQDLSTTNDVGGRMIQVVLRLNF